MTSRGISSNPTRPCFSLAAIFRDSDFFELFPSPPGKVEKSNINKKATTVVVTSPTPGYEFV